MVRLIAREISEQTPQGLVESELTDDYQASNGVYVSKSDLGLLGMYTHDKTRDFLLQQHGEDNKLNNDNPNVQ